uniref:Vacuolar protein sorting-associated protein 72 homolog n=1 Tax=Syphacia muris TaxID=451379 RepID=A0A0N5AW06_9BILA
MKRKAEEVIGNEEQNDGKRKKLDEEFENTDDEEASSSSAAEDSCDERPSAYISTTRERRANAGNRMASLLNDTEEEDEFYKNTYGGGFLEDDADDAYESPVESEHDEVDSDFYNTEEDDELVSDVDEKEHPKRRSKFLERRLDMQRRKQLLNKNRKWVMARMGGPTVAANTVSPETQAEMLEEAKETEKMNIASLKKYEQYELERKKKREKNSIVRSVKPPLIKVVDSVERKFVTVPSIKEFQKPEPKVRLLCAVTSRPAKYRDPVTGLPFSNVASFKIIRQKYIEHLRTLKNNSQVTNWLEENF